MSIDYTKLNKIIDGLEGPMTKTLQSWLRIPSEKGIPEAGAPFGSVLKTMLETALDDGAKLGFATENIDGYAGVIEMGEGSDEEAIAILNHLDIVPAGEGWDIDPFGGEIINHKIYGRGAGDNKGPAVAALYAMYALKESGIKFNKKVKLILGCDEESGMEDMIYYKKHRIMPKIGFSPDAEYPVINTEKGRCQILLKANISNQSDLKIYEIHGGERPNVIPGAAYALIEGDQATINKISEYAKKENVTIETEIVSPNKIKLKAIGTIGHAAMPELGRNANGILLKALAALGAKGAIAWLAEHIGIEYNGASLGIAVSDSISGPLTCNLGILSCDGQEVCATLDIRYPVMASSQAILQSIARKGEKENIKVILESDTMPHHVPEDSELVQALLSAYEFITGEKGEALAIGGGTYAKCIEQGVAFGAMFPGEEELAHQAGEYMSINSLMKNIRIIAQAIINLAA